MLTKRRISRLHPAAALAALLAIFVMAGVSGCVEPDEGSPPDTPAADTSVPLDEGTTDTSGEDAPPAEDNLELDGAPNDDVTDLGPCPPPEAPIEGTPLSCFKADDCVVIWAEEQSKADSLIECRAYCSEWTGVVPPLEWASPDYVIGTCDW